MPMRRWLAYSRCTWRRCVSGEIVGWDGKGVDRETLTVAERFPDAPRPGAPATFTEEQRCQIAAFACEAPMKAERDRSASGQAERSRTNGEREASLSTSRHDRRALGSKKGLQPHRFRSWFTEEPDPHRDEKMVDGCEGDRSASERARQRERTISRDALTGVQA